MKYQLIILICAMPVLAADQSGDFIRKQKGFIKSLYIQGNHYGCVSETERLLHYDKSNPEKYDYFITANYYLWGQYRSVLHRIGNENDDTRHRLLRAHSFLGLGMPARALNAVENCQYANTDDPYRRDLFLARMHAYLDTGEYDRLAREIETADEFFRDRQRFATIRENVSAINSMHLKSKSLAAGLSAVLPGAGQVYGGRYIEGLLSFAAVGLTGYGAYYFYSRRQNGLAGTMVFFTALFYAGNIYGGYNSAGSYNQRALADYRRGIEKQLVPGYSPLNESDIRGLFE